MKRKRNESHSEESFHSASKAMRLEIYPHVHRSTTSGSLLAHMDSDAAMQDDQPNHIAIKGGSSLFRIELDEGVGSLHSLHHESRNAGRTESFSAVQKKHYQEKMQLWKQKHATRIERMAKEPKMSMASIVHSADSHKLLSQKYEATSFLDLLTDHSSNREVLKWLKEWNQIVFNAPSNTLSSSSHTVSPKQKILLLCGPPGVGKTTLAHTVAAHCGYTIMEINASDDRAKTALVQQIKARTQTKSVLKPQKPKLVLLDEIDGALTDSSDGHRGSSAISQLIKMAKSKTDPLSRPIICTCNDLYAPALKELRSYAKIVVFKRDSANQERILSRLQFICKNEKIPVNANDLHKLVHTYQSDIRSCLNALHFLKLGFSAQSKSLSGGNSSLKDLDKGYFDIMQFIFNHKAHSLTEMFHFLYSEVGDFKLVDGCFSNYLHQPFSDPDFVKIRKTIDYLSYCDLYSSTALRHSQFSLNVYTLCGILASHLYCRPNTTKFVKLHLPLDYFQARKKTRDHIYLLNQRFRAAILPPLYSFYALNDILLHVLSPLYTILNTPQIRKDISDIYLLSKYESQILQHLLLIHKSLGLTYEFQYANSRAGRYHSSDSSTSEEQTNQYALNPNIFELLLDFDQSVSTRGTTYAIPLCQYINHGKEGDQASNPLVEKMRQEASASKEENSPFFGKLRSNVNSPMHNEDPVKFVFEDSASKAVRYAVNLSEFS